MIGEGEMGEGDIRGAEINWCNWIFNSGNTCLTALDALPPYKSNIVFAP